MDEQPTNTPHATAAMLDITPVTLRRWCEYHSAHLSAGANPPTGKARRFTGRDLEVFKHVRSLRAQGLTVSDINEQLQSLTFAVVDTDEQSAGDSEETRSIDLVSASQESLQQAPQAFVVALDSLQRQIDGLQASRRDNVQWFALGFLVAGFLFLGMVLLSWLHGGSP